jgi:hypothetical protein
LDGLNVGLNRFSAYLTRYFVIGPGLIWISPLERSIDSRSLSWLLWLLVSMVDTRNLDVEKVARHASKPEEE